MNSDPPETPPPSRRRWYQFSLRSLLGLMLVCAIGCSWFATKLRAVRREREAAAALRHFRGVVSYDYEHGRSPSGPPGSRWLHRLLGKDFFGHVDRVCLAATREFTDATLAHVEDTPKLKFLSVEGAGITDDGLRHLKGLAELETLDLAFAAIGDAGLTHLEGLTQLKELNLEGTAVTEAGVKRLQRALPKCTIDSDGPAPDAPARAAAPHMQTEDTSTDPFSPNDVKR